MKCVCGHEEEHFIPIEVRDEHYFISAVTIKLEDGKEPEVQLYACPVCGTLKFMNLELKTRGKDKK